MSRDIPPPTGSRIRELDPCSQPFGSLVTLLGSPSQLTSLFDPLTPNSSFACFLVCSFVPIYNFYWATTVLCVTQGQHLYRIIRTGKRLGMFLGPAAGITIRLVTSVHSGSDDPSGNSRGSTSRWQGCLVRRFMPSI